MQETGQGENAAVLEVPRVDGLGLPGVAAAGECTWIQPMAVREPLDGALSAPNLLHVADFVVGDILAAVSAALLVVVAAVFSLISSPSPKITVTEVI